MIYVVEILNRQFVKVGYSGNPDVSSRIAELQTGCPFEIKPIASVAGTLRQEQFLHGALRDMFAQMRVPMPPNEWYPGRTQFMSEFIANIKLGVDIAVSFCDSKNWMSVDKGSRRGTEHRSDWIPNAKWPRKADASAIRQEFPGLLPAL